MPVKTVILAIGCAAALALANSTQATPINVLAPLEDFPAKDISDVTGSPGLGDANVLAWLQVEAGEAKLPDPTTAQSDYTDGPILAGDYLVLHYGAGPGGTPAGGLVALYFDVDVASFSVPANGSGPNGFGGISFARLYDHTTVPDGGATFVLMGFGLAALGSVSRSLKSRN